MHNYSFIIPRYYNGFSFNSCFPCTTRLWNSLSTECSSSTYDLSGLNFRVNRQFFFLGYFRNSFHIGFLTFDYSPPCNSMLFSENPSLHWVNPSNSNVFIHTTLKVVPKVVQLKVVPNIFLNVQENVTWIKQLKFDQQILFLKTWDFFYPILFEEKTLNVWYTNIKANQKLFPVFSMVHVGGCLTIAGEGWCSVNQRT